MKKSLTISTIMLCSLFSLQLHGQSLSAHAYGQIFGMTEYETPFIGGGLGVEGRLGNSFTLGIDGGYADHERFRTVNFQSTIKFYPFESFRGFYAGLGFDVFRIEKKSGLPIGFPFDDVEGPVAVAGGPEFVIGVSTVIEDTFTMGIQTGLGALPFAEMAFIHFQFRFGIVL